MKTRVLLERVRNGIVRLLQPRNYLAGSYDAASWNVGRSQVFAPIADSRIDIDECTRRELLRKARHLHRNSPVTRALIERLVTLAIGPGLIPVPASRNQQWNTQAFAAFLNWARSPDYTTRMTWWQMQRVIARAMFVDGDIFSYLTYSPETNLPALQLVESHLVHSKEAVLNKTPDGVNLDKTGRPISFTVWESSEDQTTSRIIKAPLMVQHILYERARQYRGVSVLATAINTAHDIQDILALEKSAVKSLSARKDVIKNAAGELDPEAAQRSGAAPTYPTPTERVDYYKQVLGPETIVLAHGDDAQAWEPKRPSPTWEGFMDFLANTVCLSANLPPSVLLQMKVGGADTRRDLAMAQRVVGVWQQDLATQFERHYEYAIGAEIEAGTLANPPEDWRAVSWQGPKDLTVDAGREAAQDREDVKMGLMSLREYYGRFQINWRTEIDQIADEQAYVRDAAEARGLRPADIMLKDPNLLSASNGQETPTEPESEGEPQRTPFELEEETT